MRILFIGDIFGRPGRNIVKDRLSKLSGPEFDRAYMTAMLSDHRKDVNEFKMESTSGKDPDVKAFASKTLPTLEDHLRQIEGLQKQSIAARSTASKSSTSPAATPK